MDKFTRKAIREMATEAGVEMPRELENALIDLYTNARDSYAESAVNNAIANSKPGEDAIRESEVYKKLETEYNDYKNTQALQASKAAKENAARAYFEARNITGKNLEIAMRGSRAEIDALEMDGEKIKDVSTLDGLISGVYSGLTIQASTQGAGLPTPPESTPVDLGSLSMDEYIKVRKEQNNG